MEIILVTVAVIIAVLIFRSSMKQEPKPNYKSHEPENLDDRQRAINRSLAKLSTESSNIICNLQATESDMQRHKRIQEKIKELEKEKTAIKNQLSKININTESVHQESIESTQKRAALAITLMKEKDITEEKANAIILNKIKIHQLKYSLNEINKDQSFELAAQEVYELLEKNINA